eukprot:CAMPEP_0115881214 /NCGR_PEP_ID=MMETSP0287-20121206/28310_1 /TAXON_ID=412157 /ORGANISM="Chrysochromulina rotalis, Strain UIO044" /LENGTH=314 /DNA_ID=CAMNT_0003337127 /DNA_START=85 /DNA_END=1029 /DNA_ORIENTATION=+
MTERPCAEPPAPSRLRRAACAEPALEGLERRRDAPLGGHRLGVRRERRVSAHLPPVLAHLGVPVDGALQALLELDLRRPAERVQLVRANVIPHVVERAVLNECDVLLGVLDLRLESPDELLRDLQVGVLGLAADVVRLAVDAFVQDGDEGRRHVAHVDEVPAVAPVAVDAARHAVEQPAHKLRDDLLGVLVRTVDVVAARDDYGQLERAVVRLDDVLSCRLRRGVWVGRLKCIRLYATDVIAHSAVDLVGGDVDKAFDAMEFGGFNEHVRSHYVVLGERERVSKRVVHVRLCGGVDDGVDLLRLQHILDKISGE